MSKDNILILKNTGVLFIRLITTSIIGLFSSRFVIQNLGTSDYGLYSVVGGIVIMLAFINTVMTAATYRFIAYELGKKNDDNVREIFNISLVIHLVMAILVILLTETLGVYYVHNYLNMDPSKLNDALFILRFSSIATVFSILSVPYLGLITALERFEVRAFVEILRSVLSLISAGFLFYYFGNKLRMYSILIAVSNMLPLLLYYYYSRKKLNNYTRWEFSRNKSKYKEILIYSSWTTLGAAASVGHSTGMALIVNLFFGTILNAAYGIARQLNGMVMMFSQNLAQAAVPQITKSYSGGNLTRSNNLVVYMSKYTWFLLAIPALPILMETELLIKIWLKNAPEYSVFFAQLFIINSLIMALGNGISSAFQANGNIRHFQLLQSVTTLLIVPVSYILFKLGFKPYSLMPAYIALSVINYVSALILAKILLGFDVVFFLKSTLFKILKVILFLIPLFFLRDLFHPGILRLFFLSFAATLYFIAMIYFLGLEKKEKEMISKIVINTSSKLRKILKFKS